jgi:1-phosphofructokinase family hexose kinase
MILCVSPNLCYDRVLVVRGFRTGEVHRAESATGLASGKGLNIARAARMLGVPLTVTGFATGDAGRAVVRGARESGLSLDAVRLRGTTRVCTLIVDPGRSETVVNEPGAQVGARAVRALRRRIEGYLPGSSLLVIAGSLPPGMPAAFPAEVIRAAGSRPVILDTPGDAFRLGVAAGPAVAKLNRRELEATLHRSLTGLREVVQGARDLLGEGARAALVTLGPDGAILVTPTGAWRLTPPRVDRVNAVGAGDSLSAGLAAGLVQGRSLLEAVRLGMAAAASDVGTLLPGTIEPAQVEAFETQVGIETL